MDSVAQFKEAQKEGWKHFAPLETVTTPAAASLVRFAGVSPGMRVLDVGCGTGVVAITAARLGAHVDAIDLTPQLLERARENARIAQVEIEFLEADAEQLPFRDGEFDAVVSQFAHMFAPRPEVATREMLRVLRPGGTIAFSTWPPELLVGRTMQLASRYMPPPPPGVVAPITWGDPQIVTQRLGSAVENIVFDRDCILVPALTPQHFRAVIERSAGPIIKMVQALSASQPERLEAYRAEFDAIVSQYMRDIWFNKVTCSHAPANPEPDTPHERKIMASYLDELYAHQEWADAEHWRAFEAHPAALADHALCERLVHIHQVQYAYLWMVGPRPSSFAFKELKDYGRMADLRRDARLYHTSVAKVLKDLTNAQLEEIIDAPWFSRPMNISRRHALMQAAMHSHYHRGQNATRLRELGGAPPITDFIMWIRAGQPSARWE